MLPYFGMDQKTLCHMGSNYMLSKTSTRFSCKGLLLVQKIRKYYLKKPFKSEIGFFTHVPRSLPKNSFLVYDIYTKKMKAGHPFMVSGVFPSTYHQRVV